MAYFSICQERDVQINLMRLSFITANDDKDLDIGKTFIISKETIW